MKMTEPQRKRWERIRAKGRKRFIWLTGVVAWGIPTGLLWSAGMSWFMRWSLPSILPMALIVFSIGGYWFGATMWRQMEDRYEQSVRE